MQLTINNTPITLIFGTGAFEDCCDRLDLSLVDLDLLEAENEQKFLNEITFSALRNGADINGQAFDLTYKQFVHWLDQEPQETAKKIMDAYMDSKYLGKTMRDHYNDLIARFEASQTESNPSPVKKKLTPSVK